METTVKTTKKTKKSSNARMTKQEPQRLSAIGIWRRENPGGIAVVLDRRAVNK